MIRHFFALDGKSSVDFNTWIAQSNMWDGAVHDDTMVEVPGRNGALVFSNGRYKNFVAKLSCYIPDEMRVNVDDLRSFLSSKYGYVKYEDNLHPDEYRMVRYAGGFSLSESDRVGAAFDLTFDCKPQRFLKSGETPVEFTANGVIWNPTLYMARPLLRLYGTAGESGNFNITGSRRLEITVLIPSEGYIDIDTEIGEAYVGDTSYNANVTFHSTNVWMDFPEIEPGENSVNMWGDVSKAVITPRWWTI